MHFQTAVAHTDEPSESSSEEDDDEALARRRALMREKARQIADQAHIESTIERESDSEKEGQHEEEEEDELSEYESYTDSDDDDVPLIKPVFVSKYVDPRSISF